MDTQQVLSPGPRARSISPVCGEDEHQIAGQGSGGKASLATDGVMNVKERAAAGACMPSLAS